MKKITKTKALFLTFIGILAISTSQIISQFIELNDLIKGLCMGIGIGLLLTSLIFGNFKTAQ